MLNRPINPWWTVAAGTLGCALGAGNIMVYSYGILAANMGAEYGWNREILGANMTAFLAGSGVGSVTLGLLISRYGVRAPAAIFAALFGLFFATAAVLPPDPMLHHLLFFLVGVGGAACTSMPYAVAISGFFDDRRGLALGAVVAGAGFGATFGPQLVQHLVEHTGWRSGFLVLGALAGLVPVVGLTFLVRTPKGVVRRGRGDPGAETPTPLRELVGDRRLWIILVPILFVSLTAFGGMGSLVPLFRDNRFEPATIAAILSFAGLTSWIGRLAVGYLLDQVFAPYLCALLFVLCGAGLMTLAATSTAPPAFLGAALVAIALGAEGDLISFLVSRYFRLVDFSRLTGWIWVVWAWSGSFGTALTNNIHKATGSYDMAYLVFAGLLGISAGVICFLGPYRNATGALRRPRAAVAE